MYFDALLFLKSTVVNRPTSGNCESPVDPDDDPDDPDVEEVDAGERRPNEHEGEKRTANKKKKNDSSEFETSVLDILRGKKNEVDEDQSFLLSLLPAFKKLNVDAKFEVKIEFLKLLQKHSTPPPPPPPPPPQQPQAHSTPQYYAPEYNMGPYWQNPPAPYYEYNVAPHESGFTSPRSVGVPDREPARDADTSGPLSV